MLLRPRWLAGHLLVLAMATLFVTLGSWQLGRHQDRAASRDEAREAFGAPAAPFDAAAPPSPGARVSLRGTFDRDHQALLRNRVRDGQGGFDVLAPLRTDEGAVVLVDRGWIPRTAADAVPEPPGGTVEVRGVAGTTRDLQPQDEVDVRAGAVVLPRVDVGHLADAWRLPLVETWVTAQWQEPPPTGSQPRLPDPPSGSDVNHLSYAIQWFTLAAIPIVGWPILLWRVRRRDGRRRAPASHVHEQER